MGVAELFEILMLVSFGLAWPMSIYKSYTSCSNDGKSLSFLYTILFGYICGLIFQYLMAHGFDYVFIFFFINTGMVMTDIIIHYRNRGFKKREGIL